MNPGGGAIDSMMIAPVLAQRDSAALTARETLPQEMPHAQTIRLEFAGGGLSVDMAENVEADSLGQ